MAANEKSALVRLQLASVLQRLQSPNGLFSPKRCFHTPEDANDPFLSHMVWFGISPLAKHEPVGLVATRKGLPMAQSDALDRPQPRHAAGDAEHAARHQQSDEVLEGMSEAFKGLRKAPKPANWDKVVSTSKSPLIRDLSILFGDGRALDDVKKIALDDKADITAREAALKTLIEARPDDLRTICTQLIEVRTLNTTAARGLASLMIPRSASSSRRTTASSRPASSTRSSRVPPSPKPCSAKWPPEKSRAPT
jgi:hypothetical protein